MNRRGFIFLVILGILLPIGVDAATPRPRDIHPNATIDIWVDPLGSHNYYWNNIEEGYTIHIDFDVTYGTDIDFYILDEENYDLWHNNQDAYAEVIKESIGSISESFTVPSSGEWHMLFINNDWLFSRHIEGTVTVSAPYVPNDLSTDGIIEGAAFLVFIVLVVGVISREYQKKQNAFSGQQSVYGQTQGHATPIPRQTQQGGYCPYCGAPRVDSNAGFCSRCGRAFRGPELG
ncbi:MAG: hypothetical protein EAX87_06055 [Candidatus Thorarchaeota archaeon]|nr:hypothetical protein [Candidatus Thorarchaeota archaeon]